MFENFLLDTWHVSGDSLEMLQRDITELSSKTEIIPMQTNTGIEADGIFSIHSYNDGILYSKKQGRSVAITGVNENAEESGSEAIVPEILKTSKMCLRNAKTLFFVSELSYLTFTQRLEMGNSIQYACEERDDFIQKIMEHKNTAWQFCVRKTGTGKKGHLKKIFAVFSEKYRPISQEFLLSLVEYFCSGKTPLAEGHVSSYQISHTATEVFCEFPKAAFSVSPTYRLSEEYIPCIRFLTSDTGHYRFTATACFRRKDSQNYIRMDSMEIKHRGRSPITEERIISEAEDILFPNFTKLPDLLAQYCLKPAGDVEALLTKLMDSAKISSFLGNRRASRTKELLMEEFSEGDAYTVYDVVFALLDLPDRLKGLPAYLTDGGLETLCGRVPFFPFLKKWSGTDPDDSDDDVFLIG